MLGSEGKDERRKFANEDEYKQWIKQGNRYGNGFLLSDLRRAETLKDIDLPIGAPPEYHYHFADLWMCYSRQLLSTNGMDLDTFPGEGGGDAWTLDLKALGSTDNDLIQINDLAELAIKEYNEESNFHKYELLKIEKVNLRETAYAEYFMTVKVRNLTLGTVVETFHIHAGQQGIAQRNGDESVTEWRWNEWHLNSNCRFTLSIRFLNFVVVENISVSVFGMDPDTFPGPAETCDACPLDLTAPCSKRELVHCKELADLAIKEYNDESNFHKYELLKIQKVNFRETASSEYFMTVKVKNLTLGTVVETFQIHADHWGIAKSNVDGSVTGMNGGI
ncbi:hypothetical protein T459_31435 [Capsicum annuum]|uniref:Cystatin domain-containing protein n=1 Tax=Capsicum annuum TaxID=4072 RepID=A0A2G2YBB5_CAPAN|nr:hypothetical protein T459_31435 [Capsicum annuum]